MLLDFFFLIKVLKIRIHFLQSIFKSIEYYKHKSSLEPM